MYVHMYQICEGLFSACSYLLKPTGNHGQTQEGVLGVVSGFVSVSFISIQGFIACSILATEIEHLASLISTRYITLGMPLW